MTFDIAVAQELPSRRRVLLVFANATPRHRPLVELETIGLDRRLAHRAEDLFDPTNVHAATAEKINEDPDRDLLRRQHPGGAVSYAGAR